MILIAGVSAESLAVMEQLATRDIDVRVLTRRAGGMGAAGHIHMVHGEITDPESARRALSGAVAVYVAARHHLSAARIDIGFLDLAYDAGVRRVVVASSTAIDDWATIQPNPTAAAFYELEQRVRHSGLDWTVLRVDAGSADALRWALDVPAQLRAGDVVRGPYAGAAGAPLHRSDFAAAVVAALTDGGHARRTYTLTGPASLTHAEQIRLIGQVRSRTLFYQELDPADARARMAADAPADLLMELWAQHVGRPAPITDALEFLIGQRPRSARQWAIDYPVQTPDAHLDDRLRLTG